MASVAANKAVDRITIVANAVLFCITLYDGEYYFSFPINRS